MMENALLKEHHMLPLRARRLPAYPIVSFVLMRNASLGWPLWLPTDILYLKDSFSRLDVCFSF